MMKAKMMAAGGMTKKGYAAGGMTKKGLERATKELKGFDKVVATGSFRLRAFAKAGGIAAAAGLTIFAKKAVDAALAQERLDKSLKLTLSSIGRGGFATEVNAFIDSTQAATNVTKEQLIPALQQLITQTGDLEASQGLLTVALDTSAGTGKDLSTVLDAILRWVLTSLAYLSDATLRNNLTVLMMSLIVLSVGTPWKVVDTKSCALRSTAGSTLASSTSLLLKRPPCVIFANSVIPELNDDAFLFTLA